MLSGPPVLPSLLARRERTQLQDKKFSSKVRPPAIWLADSTHSTLDVIGLLFLIFCSTVAPIWMRYRPTTKNSIDVQYFCSWGKFAEFKCVIGGCVSPIVEAKFAPQIHINSGMSERGIIFLGKSYEILLSCVSYFSGLYTKWFRIHKAMFRLTAWPWAWLGWTELKLSGNPQILYIWWPVVPYGQEVPRYFSRFSTVPNTDSRKGKGWFPVFSFSQTNLQIDESLSKISGIGRGGSQSSELANSSGSLYINPISAGSEILTA